MYKLTIVSGPRLGTAYAIHEGRNSIGRQTDNAVVLPSGRVSKHHCVLVVTQNEVRVQDRGSANGTFVNGVLAKNRRLSPGDRISVGEYVLEITSPEVKGLPAPVPFDIGSQHQRKGAEVIQFPVSQTAGKESSGQIAGVPGIGSSADGPNGVPQDVKGKANFYIEKYVMLIFYSLNLKYEWKFIAAGLIAAFIIVSLSISVQPLLEASRKSVIKESLRRASLIARQLAEKNAPALAAKNETKLDAGSFGDGEDVKLAVVTDLDNRILAPAAQLNQYLTSGQEAVFAVRAAEKFKNGSEAGFASELDDSTIIAVEPIRVVSTIAGRNVAVGMTVVALDSSIVTLGAGAIGMVYSETLILMAFIAIIFFYILYRVTLKPLQVLEEEVDRVLKRDLVNISHEYKFKELNSLWTLIQSALQRIGGQNQFSGSGGQEANLGEDIGSAMQALGGLIPFGFVFCDPERKIVCLNAAFEEVSGIRSDSAKGQIFNTVVRDQALGAFVDDLLDRSMSQGGNLEENFEFSGISYRVHAMVLGAPGGAVKGFVIAAVKSEAA